MSEKSVCDHPMPSSAGRPARRHKHPLLVVLAGVLVVTMFSILISLGIWQVHRLHWKEGLLAKIAERMHAPAVPLARIENLYDQGKDVEYRHVRVSGAFDNSKERHFLATFDGQSGFDIFTPLITGSGRTLFVNRGFVPYDRKARATRPESLAKGHVTLTGLVRVPPSEKPSAMIPDNSVAKNIFYWKDLKTMAASTGLANAKLVPFFVDADRVKGSRTLPVGGATVVDLPNNHLQYAITWFGLAAVLVFVTGSYIHGRYFGEGKDDDAGENTIRP